MLVIQPTDIANQIIDPFQASSKALGNAALVYGRALFVVLATIDLCWGMWETWDNSGGNFEPWVRGVFTKVMKLLFFFTLMNFSTVWLPLIPEGFKAIGQRITGLVVISPGDILARGLNITSGMIETTSSLGGISTLIVGQLVMICSLVIFLSFLWIAGHYTVTLIETAVLVCVGAVFTSFGGSKWTMPWVERILAMPVAIGVKFMLYFICIGIAQQVSAGWVNMAQQIGTSPHKAQDCFVIMGQAIVMAYIVWYIPKHYSSFLSASPNAHAGDVVAMAAAGASMGIAAVTTGTNLASGVGGLLGGSGSAAATAGGKAAGSLSVGSGGGASTEVAMVRSGGSGFVPPPMSSNGGGGSNGNGGQRNGSGRSTRSNNQGGSNNS